MPAPSTCLWPSHQLLRHEPAIVSNQAEIALAQDALDLGQLVVAEPTPATGIASSRRINVLDQVVACVCVAGPCTGSR
jgi:hypothetical protein